MSRAVGYFKKTFKKLDGHILVMEGLTGWRATNIDSYTVRTPDGALDLSASSLTSRRHNFAFKNPNNP